MGINYQLSVLLPFPLLLPQSPLDGIAILLASLASQPGYDMGDTLSLLLNLISIVTQSHSIWDCYITRIIFIPMILVPSLRGLYPDLYLSDSLI